MPHRFEELSVPKYGLIAQPLIFTPASFFMLDTRRTCSCAIKNTVMGKPNVSQNFSEFVICRVQIWGSGVL